MNMEINADGPVTIAKVSGQFDLGDEKRLGDELHPLVAEPNSRVALDLSELAAINSQGLSQLINMVIRSRMNRSKVVMIAPTPFVMGVMEVTRLDAWFEIVDDVEAAVDLLNA